MSFHKPPPPNSDPSRDSYSDNDTQSIRGLCCAEIGLSLRCGRAYNLVSPLARSEGLGCFSMQRAWASFRTMGYFRDNVERTAGYTPGFQPKAAEVVKLNTNEYPYPPSPLVMKTLAQIKPGLRRYPDPMGTSFREAAARLNGVEPENIMCCNGGDDLLSIAIRAFCDEGRPLAYPVPTYSLYPVLARLQNCEAIEIPFGEKFDLPAQLATTGRR